MLDRENNDKIRKITSIFRICINRNTVKWISLYAKKVRYLLHVCYMYWKTLQPEEFVFCKYSLLNLQFYSLQLYSEPNPELIWIATFKDSLGRSPSYKLIEIPINWGYLEFKHPRIHLLDRCTRYVRVILVVLPIKVQFNCINYKESWFGDYAIQIKVSISLPVKFLRFT